MVAGGGGAGAGAGGAGGCRESERLGAWKPGSLGEPGRGSSCPLSDH